MQMFNHGTLRLTGKWCGPRTSKTHLASLSVLCITSSQPDVTMTTRGEGMAFWHLLPILSVEALIG